MPISPVAGQEYGASQQQMQLERSLPTPNLRNEPLPPTTVPQPAGAAPPAPGGAAADPHAAALAAAAALRGQTGLLQQPSTRPNEPITAGLPIGPGPGPEVLAGRIGTPAGDLFRRLTAETGDPLFAELASRVRA